MTVFPYGHVGRHVCELLKQIWNITPLYRVDNYAQDAGCLTLREFVNVYKPGTMTIIMATTDLAVFRDLMRELFVANIDARDVRILRPDFLLGNEALEWMLNHRDKYQTVLDVGCGAGLQGRFMSDYGLDVTGLTMSDDIDYSGSCLQQVVKADFFKYQGGPFDVVWASHILEHIPLPEKFLRHVREVIRPDGCLALSVPYNEQNILASHIHTFNAGRVLRYLLCAGYDCRNAQILTYGYNLSVILPHVRYIDEVFDITEAQSSGNIHGSGEVIFDYLPPGIDVLETWNHINYFQADIKEYGWERGAKTHL